MDETTPEPIQGDKPEEKSFNISVNMTVVPNITPIWVVKMPNGRYLRASTTQTMMSVKERRLATRFDSAVWAATCAAWCEGAKVKRLWAKGEREVLTGSGTTWRYPRVNVDAQPSSVSTPEEPSK